jgi:hypothetical protein
MTEQAHAADRVAADKTTITLNDGRVVKLAFGPLATRIIEKKYITLDDAFEQMAKGALGPVLDMTHALVAHAGITAEQLDALVDMSRLGEYAEAAFATVTQSLGVDTTTKGRKGKTKAAADTGEAAAA